MLSLHDDSKHLEYVYSWFYTDKEIYKNKESENLVMENIIKMISPEPKLNYFEATPKICQEEFKNFNNAKWEKYKDNIYDMQLIINVIDRHYDIYQTLTLIKEENLFKWVLYAIERLRKCTLRVGYKFDFNKIKDLKDKWYVNYFYRNVILSPYEKGFFDLFGFIEKLFDYVNVCRKKKSSEIKTFPSVFYRNNSMFQENYKFPLFVIHYYNSVLLFGDEIFNLNYEQKEDLKNILMKISIIPSEFYYNVSIFGNYADYGNTIFNPLQNIHSYLKIIYKMLVILIVNENHPFQVKERIYLNNIFRDLKNYTRLQLHYESIDTGGEGPWLKNKQLTRLSLKSLIDTLNCILFLVYDTFAMEQVSVKYGIPESIERVICSYME